MTLELLAIAGYAIFFFVLNPLANSFEIKNKRDEQQESKRANGKLCRQRQHCRVIPSKQYSFRLRKRNLWCRDSWNSADASILELWIWSLVFFFFFRDFWTIFVFSSVRIHTVILHKFHHSYGICVFDTRKCFDHKLKIDWKIEG